jgi:NAD(P)-dependent dehydrogenase (short-subunit alcohol dehydrogenase family)
VSPSPASEDLPQRTALVTGASRGIGRATVEALADSGWRVVAGVRNPETIESPFPLPSVHVVTLDVTDTASVRAAVSRAEDIAGGALGCVVNNAGWALFGAIEDVDLDVARQEFETNFFGAAAVLQAALPAMTAAGGGVVVSVSSLVGEIPLPLFGIYSATKLSLRALSEALALEVAPSGIRVVLVEAGVVRTELAKSTIVSGSAGEPESPYADTRARLLGTIRQIRDDNGLTAREVAEPLVRAVNDPAAPFHLRLPDSRLAELAPLLERPAGEFHDQVRQFFGFAGPPTTERRA